MSIILGNTTKGKISTVNAPKPGPSTDPNVGKVSFTRSGVYKGLPGIVYPKHEGIKYTQSVPGYFEGTHNLEVKPYLLLIFYEDGSLFCGVPVAPEDLGLDTTLPSGSGTLGDPYSCSSGIWYNTGILQKSGRNPEIIHWLPWKAGRVTVSMTVEVSNPNGNSTAFGFEIVSLSTGNRLAYNAPSFTWGGLVSTSFYYDPQFTGDLIVVKPLAIFPQWRDSGSTRYMFGCPV